MLRLPQGSGNLPWLSSFPLWSLRPSFGTYLHEGWSVFSYINHLISRRDGPILQSCSLNSDYKLNKRSQDTWTSPEEASDNIHREKEFSNRGSRIKFCFLDSRYCAYFWQNSSRSMASSSIREVYMCFVRGLVAKYHQFRGFSKRNLFCWFHRNPGLEC